MKKIVLWILFFSAPFLFFNFSQAQSGQWTWIHGSSSPYSGGSPGVQGMASPANEPPALYEACEWTDLQGNFWLFGGTDGGSNAHGQLWKYDPVNNEWTWMTGL